MDYHAFVLHTPPTPHWVLAVTDRRINKLTYSPVGIGSVWNGSRVCKQIFDNNSRAYCVTSSLYRLMHAQTSSYSVLNLSFAEVFPSHITTAVSVAIVICFATQIYVAVRFYYECSSAISFGIPVMVEHNFVIHPFIATSAVVTRVIGHRALTSIASFPV